MKKNQFFKKFLMFLLHSVILHYDLIWADAINWLININFRLDLFCLYQLKQMMNNQKFQVYTRGFTSKCLSNTEPTLPNLSWPKFKHNVYCILLNTIESYPDLNWTISLQKQHKTSGRKGTIGCYYTSPQSFNLKYLIFCVRFLKTIGDFDWLVH